MISQHDLTKIFLQQWGKVADEANIKLYSRKWWKSTRTGKSNSYRLSDEGFRFLTSTLGLISYEIQFNDNTDTNAQFIINLEKYIDCPYYLTTNSIIVFSERKSIELSLFTDDINKFLIQKALKHQQNI